MTGPPRRICSRRCRRRRGARGRRDSARPRGARRRGAALRQRRAAAAARERHRRHRCVWGARYPRCGACAPRRRSPVLRAPPPPAATVRRTSLASPRRRARRNRGRERPRAPRRSLLSIPNARENVFSFSLAPRIGRGRGGTTPADARGKPSETDGRGAGSGDPRRPAAAARTAQRAVCGRRPFLAAAAARRAPAATGREPRGARARPPAPAPRSRENSGRAHDGARVFFFCVRFSLSRAGGPNLIIARRTRGRARRRARARTHAPR